MGIFLYCWLNINIFCSKELKDLVDLVLIWLYVCFDRFVGFIEFFFSVDDVEGRWGLSMDLDFV